MVEGRQLPTGRLDGAPGMVTMHLVTVDAGTPVRFDMVVDE
jgi:hypothetical protein